MAKTGKISGLELDVEDVAEITLRFENGLIGSVHLDYFQRPPEHTLQISFERGLVRWDNATGAAEVYSVDEDCWETLSPLRILNATNYSSMRQPISWRCCWVRLVPAVT